MNHVRSAGMRTASSPVVIKDEVRSCFKRHPEQKLTRGQCELQLRLKLGVTKRRVSADVGLPGGTRTNFAVHRGTKKIQ